MISYHQGIPDLLKKWIDNNLSFEIGLPGIRYLFRFDGSMWYIECARARIQFAADVIRLDHVEGTIEFYVEGGHSHVGSLWIAEFTVVRRYSE